MPFFLLLVGIMLLVIGVQNTPSEFLALLKGDFTGQNSFTFWVIGLIAVGALGYWDRAKPISDALLALIIVALFLSHGALFTSLNIALQNTTSVGNTLGLGGLTGILGSPTVGVGVGTPGGTVGGWVPL